MLVRSLTILRLLRLVYHKLVEKGPARYRLSLAFAQ